MIWIVLKSKEPTGYYNQKEIPIRDITKFWPTIQLWQSKNSIKKEIQGLLKRNSFAFVHKKDIKNDTNILIGRFILAIKQPGADNERYNAPFIVQGHKDKDKNLIIHTYTTVRHKNILITSSISAVFPAYKIWLQDVTKAYIQEKDLQREVYLKPADQLKLSKKHT